MASVRPVVCTTYASCVYTLPLPSHESGRGSLKRSQYLRYYKFDQVEIWASSQNQQYFVGGLPFYIVILYVTVTAVFHLHARLLSDF